MVEWVTHEGRRVLVARFRGLSDERALELIDEAQAEILKLCDQPHSVLFLTCGATSLTDPLTRRWEEFGKATESVVKATAVEGLPFFVRAVAKLMKPSIYFASSEEDAFNWLVEQ